jgi:SAM-dependent methyltransferase
MTADPAFYELDSLNVESYDAQTEAVQPALGGDIDFYRVLAQRTGGPILDLGGGTGRVAWPLAEAGFDVTSLDSSAPMLARSEAKRAVASPAARPRVTLVEADARSFHLPATFGLAITPGRVFQLILTPEGQRESLAAIHRHLRPDGVLVLQLFDPLLSACEAFDGVPDKADRGTVVLASGHRVTRTVVHRTTDPLQQLMTEVWDWVERDDAGTVVRTDRETLQMRWTYRYELRYLLEISGFEVTDEYSDFAGSPPRYASEQVVVARPR